jgi:superfamily I DNA/RNA helicase
LGRSEDLPPQARGGAQALLELLRLYRRRFQDEGLTAAGLGDFIRDAKLREEVRANYESPRAVERRLRILDELLETVESMTKRTGRLRLDAFLDAVTIDPPADREEEGSEAVTLLTLHSAKGLEFPVVFLTGMEEGLLPHSPDDDDPASLEEERRLCYVGMTRAKERLVLTRAKVRSRRGTARAAAASRFLSEIPGSLAECGEGAAASREEEDAMARNFFSGLAAMLEGEEK